MKWLLSILLATVSVHATYGQDLPAVPILTTGAKIVILDVVVTDQKHMPVHNLAASNFSVLEHGKAEAVWNFEEHRAENGVKVEPPLRLPPRTFTNQASVPAGTALNILLLDTLNTPFDAQPYIKNQLRLFLKDSPPKAPLAIFGLS